MLPEAWDVLNQYVMPFFEFLKKIFDAIKNFGKKDGETE